MQSPPVKRAIISVSDKLGLAGFARGLVEAGVEIFSTGGTRRHLESEGIAVTDVSAYRISGNDGRAIEDAASDDPRRNSLPPRQLHRHGGRRRVRHQDLRTGRGQPLSIRADGRPRECHGRRGDREHRHRRADHGPGRREESPVHDNRDRRRPIFRDPPGDHRQRLHVARTPKRLAAEAFAHTARYDAAIAAYFAGQRAGGRRSQGILPSPSRARACSATEKIPTSRQPLYAAANAPAANLVSAMRLNGKELSYNNLLDLDSALAIVRSFSEPAASVIKHNNPCGAAVRRTLAEALEKGLQGDPLTRLGSVLGLNRVVDAAAAELLARPGLFIEAIVAPISPPKRLEILTTRPKWKANVRLMKVGDLAESRGPGLPLHRRRHADAGGRRARRPGRRLESSPTPNRRRPSSPTSALPGISSATSNPTRSPSARIACCSAPGGQ